MEFTLNQPQPVWVHASQHLEAINQRRREALFNGRIPSAFLYAGYAQSRLWLDVFRQHAPMQHDTDFQHGYQTFFSALTDKWKTDAVHVVGLGSGGGEKEAWLLQQLTEQKKLFTPIDASDTLALLSAQHCAAYLSQPAHPLSAELTACGDLLPWLTQLDDGIPRILTCFGVTPNTAPDILLPLLHALLRPQDVLLLSANLAPVTENASYHEACQCIQTQYDNPATRRWVKQVLVDWGLTDYLTPMTFDLEVWQDLYAFTLRSHWQSATDLEWEGTHFHAEAGQSLLLFKSLRYTPERFRAWLSQFGFSIKQEMIFTSGEEGLWAVQVN